MGAAVVVVAVPQGFPNILQRSEPSLEEQRPPLQVEGMPFTREENGENAFIIRQINAHETSAVRLPTLVQVRSHTGPDVEDAAVVVGAEVVVVGEDVPHHPS